MSWQFSLFGNIFLGATFLAAVVTYKAWRRSFPGDSFFVFFMASATVWAFTSALEWYVTLSNEKAFWSQISYLGIVNVAPAWFSFSLAYCGYATILTKRNVILFWIIPVVTLLLALSNSFHGLNWPAYRLVEHPLGNYMFYEHGPSFWVLTIYSYILNLLFSIILLRQAKKMFRAYQMQSFILFVSVMIPWIGNALYNTRVVTVIDLTPIAFTITGTLMLWNMKQYRLFDIAPIARETLFTNIRELVVVLDSQNRIIDMNPFALNYFNIARAPVGNNFTEVFSQWKEFSAFLRADNIAELELKYDHQGTTEWFLVTRTPIVGSHSSSTGTLIICRDITQRKRTEHDREHLIDELQEALANVKTLGGLLPICANCKKIRDDEGYWNQVEQYIGKHTDAKFTHGICPECGKKALDEYYRTKDIPGHSSGYRKIQ
ncbi:MAG: histidine kinase N-terminal 7TM domain-containing protein [Bacteroidota bacterium]